MRPQRSARRWSNCTPAPIARPIDGDAAARRTSSSASGDGRGACRRRSAWSAMPATASASTPSTPVAAIPTDRRAQHRPLPDRRGDLRRLGRRHRAHARVDGPGAGGRPGERAPDKHHDSRHRQRPDRHPADRADPGALRRALPRPRLHRGRAAEVGPAQASGPPATPSASRPRRPAPRRWAPGCTEASTGATWAWSICPAGQPTMTLTGGALAAVERRSPARHDSRHSSYLDRRPALGAGHRPDLGRARRPARTPPPGNPTTVTPDSGSPDTQT